MLHLAFFLVDLSLSLSQLVFLVFRLPGLFVDLDHEFLAVLGFFAKLVVKDGQIFLKFIRVRLGFVQFGQTSC